MSGSGAGQIVCTSHTSHCLTGNCRCFKAKLSSSKNCKCNGCQNTEKSPAAKQQMRRCNSKRKRQDCVNDEGLSGVTPRLAVLGMSRLTVCPCSQTGCLQRNCRCLKEKLLCSGKCNCNDCGKIKNNKAKVDSRCKVIDKKMASAAMKLMVMAILAMLLTVSSAARTEPLAPVSAAIKKQELASISGYIAGCTPKTLARDLILFCREPINAHFPIEACCGVAVGTVARPSCFCLVKREPAFGMSSLLNMTAMRNMLDRCGASLHLTQSLDNPCDGSYKEDPATKCPSCKEDQADKCPAPEPNSCFSYKVLSCVGWAIIAVMMPAMGYLSLRRALPRIVYVPQVRMVTLGPGGYLKDEMLSDASSNNDNNTELLSNESSVNDNDEAINDMSLCLGNDDEELSPETSEISDARSDDVLINGKRVTVPNPKFIGPDWDNTLGRRKK